MILAKEFQRIPSIAQSQQISKKISLHQQEKTEVVLSAEASHGVISCYSLSYDHKGARRTHNQYMDQAFYGLSINYIRT